MERTTGAELTDFCLLISPTAGSAAHATDVVRDRFTFLDERIRAEMVAAIAERVQNLVEQRAGNLIAVSLAVEHDGIHGAVCEQGGPCEDGTGSRFVIPLAMRA
jgi:hypothetical protein